MTLPVLDANPANIEAKDLIGRPYLSPSSISTYLRCPLRFRFQYVERLEPDFTASSLVFGVGIHAAVEHHFRKLFADDRAATVEELVSVFEQALATEANQEIRFGRSETADTLRDLAARMLAAFVSSGYSKPQGALIGVEEGLAGTLIDGVPTIHGRADLIGLDATGVLRVTDVKTARNAWTENTIRESTLQQVIYAELLRPWAEALGADDVQAEWLVLRKTKTPAIDRHQLIIDDAQVRQVTNTIRQVWRAIRACNFYPVPSPMNCGGCPFRNACNEWEG